MKIEMQMLPDMAGQNYKLLLTIPMAMTRTDGEFKWRVAQAIILALTEKEAQYAGADTLEGMQRLESILQGSGC